MLAYLDLSRAVRNVDLLLRQHQGIQEFTEDEQCVLRISWAEAAQPLRLSDGTRVRAGDLVLQLHFWNEHVPPIPVGGPGPGWATLMRRRLCYSLRLLATQIKHDPAFGAACAVHGAPPFRSRLDGAQMVRLARRFGFDVVDPDAPVEWREHVHALFESMLLWGLIYAFNPAGSRRNAHLLRYRYQLWMSRAMLLERYAAPEWRPRSAGRG